MFPNQIISADHLLQCIGGEGIDAGQVLNDRLSVGLELAFLLFDGDSRPVSDILAASGQVIEHGCFSAVGVSC